MKEKALELVLAVYRVTKVFPEEEVLIGQMRQAANQVLAELVSERQKEAIEQIKVLLNYFQIAQAQNWIKKINFVILKKEYNELLDEIEQSSHKKKIGLAKMAKIKGLSQRQKRILEYIKNFDKFRLGDLNKYFPQTSSRTLSRDLEQLSLKGHLIKKGHGRGAFYRIKTKIKTE
jgi:hypothetical protein